MRGKGGTHALSHNKDKQSLNNKVVVVDARASEKLEFREQLLEAMGHDRTGLTASGQLICNPTHMIEVERWKSDLGLSEPEILSVVKATTCRDGPPSTPKYYTVALQRFAGEKGKEKLNSIASEAPNSEHKLPYRRPRIDPSRL